MFTNMDSHLRTHTHAMLFALEEGAPCVLLGLHAGPRSLWRTNRVFQEALRTASLQTLCFAPAGGHDPKHLRLTQAWVHRLRRGSVLVSQVCLSCHSALLT